MNKIFLVLTALAIFSLKSMTHEKWVLHELQFLDKKKYGSIDALNEAIKNDTERIQELRNNNPDSQNYYAGYALLIAELSKKWNDIDSTPFVSEDGRWYDNRSILLAGLIQAVPLWVKDNKKLLATVFLAWSNDQSKIGALRLREIVLEKTDLSKLSKDAYASIFSGFYTYLTQVCKEKEDPQLKHLLGVADATKKLVGTALASAWFAIVDRADSYSFAYHNHTWRSSFLLQHVLIRCCLSVSMMPNWPTDQIDQTRLLINFSRFFKKYDHDLALIKSVPSESIEMLLSTAFNHATITSNGTIAPVLFGPQFENDKPASIVEGIVAKKNESYSGFTDKKTPLVGALQAHWKAALWGANTIALKNLRYLAPLTANENFKTLWKTEVSRWVPFEDVAAGKNIHYSAVRNWCGYYRTPLAATALAVGVAGIAAYRACGGTGMPLSLPFLSPS